jgi:hypothetical protein
MNKQFLSEVSTLVELYGKPFGATPSAITYQFSKHTSPAYVINLGEETISIINWYIFTRTEEDTLAILAILDLIEEVKLLALRYGIKIVEMEMSL